MSSPVRAPSTARLGSLQVGQSGRIVSIQSSEFSEFGASGESGDSRRLGDFSIRLREMGFVEGARVEVAHAAPFGGDPIAIRVRGSLIAVRRIDADLIEVEPDV